MFASAARAGRFAAVAVLALASLGAAPPSLPAPVEWCAVSVTVKQESPRFVAVSFQSLVPSVISGTVALYEGDRRYDVHFDGVRTIPMPGTDLPAVAGGKPYLLVVFSTGTTIDSAVVTSITTPAVGACPVPYSPWIAANPDTVPNLPVPQDRVKYYIVDAPAPVTETVRCATPNALARKVGDPPPGWPAGKGRDFHARALVGVTIDQYGGVADARIMSSTSDREADVLAIAAAQHTPWEPGRFRCRPDVGTYTYIVDFGG